MKHLVAAKKTDVTVTAPISVHVGSFFQRENLPGFLPDLPEFNQLDKTKENRRYCQRDRVKRMSR